MIRKVIDDLWAGQPKSHHSKHTDWNAKSCSVLLDGAASYLVVTETLAAVWVEPLLDTPDGGPVDIPLQLVYALAICAFAVVCYRRWVCSAARGRLGDGRGVRPRDRGRQRGDSRSERGTGWQRLHRRIHKGPAPRALRQVALLERATHFHQNAEGGANTPRSGSTAPSTQGGQRPVRSSDLFRSPPAPVLQGPPFSLPGSPGEDREEGPPAWSEKKVDGNSGYDGDVGEAMGVSASLGHDAV